MKRGGVVSESLLKKSELVLCTDSLQSSQSGCAICREVFKPGTDICRMLDCSHIFHAKCIDHWFVRASCCPLCKNDLKVSGRNYSQRSLGRSSQTSSNISLGSGSNRSGSGHILLLGHSDSDPVMLRNLQEDFSPRRGSQASSHAASAPNLAISPPCSPEVISVSRSELSIGLLSSSSSGVLPAVLEVSEDMRAVTQSQNLGRCYSPGSLGQIVEGPESHRSTGSNRSPVQVGWPVESKDDLPEAERDDEQCESMSETSRELQDQPDAEFRRQRSKGHLHTQTQARSVALPVARALEVLARTTPPAVNRSLSIPPKAMIEGSVTTGGDGSHPARPTEDESPVKRIANEADKSAESIQGQSALRMLGNSGDTLQGSPTTTEARAVRMPQSTQPAGAQVPRHVSTEAYPANYSTLAKQKLPGTVALNQHALTTPAAQNRAYRLASGPQAATNFWAAYGTGTQQGHGRAYPHGATSSAQLLLLPQQHQQHHQQQQQQQRWPPAAAVPQVAARTGHVPIRHSGPSPHREHAAA